MNYSGLNFLMQIISYPANIMHTILKYSGTYYIWLGIVLLILIIRFIIMPLAGTNVNLFSQIRENKKEDK